MRQFKYQIGIIFLFILAAALAASAGVLLFTAHHGAYGCVAARVSGIDCATFASAIAHATRHAAIFQTMTHAPTAGALVLQLFLAAAAALALALFFKLQLIALPEISARAQYTFLETQYIPLAVGMRLWLARRPVRLPRLFFHWVRRGYSLI